ncbi:hypothetical protein [uncultured Brachyspira sp.]|uniref:hypothetical protein n=1 Tax=uncultured Brachyspira sp. TaxID=221953 RepID=UPI0025F2D720|nr:hypothetical protein [uncultured Brachyspira sp.]
MAAAKTKLLNKASKEFTSKIVSCVCYSASKINLDNGFCYILIDKTKSKIIQNITIHSNKNREMTLSGQMDIGEYIIQTPVSLSNSFKEAPELFILNYENNYFMVHSLIAYNKETNHYDYRAEILQNKNKSFIVYDITEINSNLLNNSIPLWIYNKDRLNISIYPSYLSPINLETPYLSVEVIDTKGLSMPTYSKENNNYVGQWKQDTIRLHLINAQTEAQQELAYNIQTLPQNYNENVFGVNDFINFKSASDDRQKGFGIVSNKAISDFKINYYQETLTNDAVIELIKSIIVQVNKQQITLFNLF